MIEQDEHSAFGSAKAWAIVISVFVLVWQCSPRPSSDGPVEHKCWTEVGYEKC